MLSEKIYKLRKISDSFMIMIDGSGIFLITCVVAIAIGAGLLLKSKKR